jgi:hypothetical protein
VRGTRVYFEVNPGPYAAGEGSFIGETLTRLGVKNIVPASLGPFPKLNPEYIVRANPDLIMVGQRSVDGMMQRPGWHSLRAMRGQHLCVFPADESDTLVRPGPRMAEGARMMARCLASKAPAVSKGPLSRGLHERPPRDLARRCLVAGGLAAGAGRARRLRGQCGFREPGRPAAEPAGRSGPPPPWRSRSCWEIRLPRTLGAWGAGALLGLAGAVAQGLFRNPLADPFLLGSASGASLGVAWRWRPWVGRAACWAPA